MEPDVSSDVKGALSEGIRSITDKITKIDWMLIRLIKFKYK